jgi:hypothetical protein
MFLLCAIFAIDAVVLAYANLGRWVLGGAAVTKNRLTGRRMGIGLTAFLIVGALCSFLYTGHAFLLRQLATLWMVSDPIRDSDAVVILGGGIFRRSEIAADLYHRNLTRRILVSDVVDSSHSVAEHFSDTKLSRDILLKLGVPDAAIETFGNANGNTRDEAKALRVWSEQNHASSFLIPTEFIFARRVRWIFDAEFADQGRQFSIVPFETPEFNRNNWWKSAEWRRAALNELAKFTYYVTRNLFSGKLFAHEFHS